MTPNQTRASDCQFSIRTRWVDIVPLLLKSAPRDVLREAVTHREGLNVKAHRFVQMAEQRPLGKGCPAVITKGDQENNSPINQIR